jgi:hypothetical protein
MLLALVVNPAMSAKRIDTSSNPSAMIPGEILSRSATGSGKILASRVSDRLYSL